MNRADGVNGHYCIGRQIDDYWEFWNRYEWSSAGEVFQDRKIAIKTLRFLKKVFNNKQEGKNDRQSICNNKKT